MVDEDKLLHHSPTVYDLAQQISGKIEELYNKSNSSFDNLKEVESEKEVKYEIPVVEKLMEEKDKARIGV